MSEPMTIDAVCVPADPEQAAGRLIRSGNVLDMDPARFALALDNRKQNRTRLFQWIKESLVRGVDFGAIHVVSKSNCREGNACTNKSHWSKDCLFQPGAEKICGMLGIRITFPTLRDYEAACMEGKKFDQIMLRCELIDANDTVVAEGIGCRTYAQDTDWNKGFKMAAKSALIMATIKMAGMSELFTLDIDDKPPTDDATYPTKAPQSEPQGQQKAFKNDVCPECKKEALGRSKFPPKNAPDQPPGWYCYPAWGGCGKAFACTEPRIQQAKVDETPYGKLMQALNDCRDLEELEVVRDQANAQRSKMNPVQQESFRQLMTELKGRLGSNGTGVF